MHVPRHVLLMSVLMHLCEYVLVGVRSVGDGDCVCEGGGGVGGVYRVVSRPVVPITASGLQGEQPLVDRTT